MKGCNISISSPNGDDERGDFTALVIQLKDIHRKIDHHHCNHRRKNSHAVLSNRLRTRYRPKFLYSQQSAHLSVFPVIFHFLRMFQYKIPYNSFRDSSEFISLFDENTNFFVVLTFFCHSEIIFLNKTWVFFLIK